MEEKIPIHNFVVDDDSSVPFRLLPLEKRVEYDTSREHRHNYYEIFFFTKGGGEHAIDMQTFPIKSNSLHFVSPGQVHRVRRELDSYGFVLLFSRDFYYLNLKNTDVLFEMPFLHNYVDKPILNLEKDEFGFFTSILANINSIEADAGIFEQEMIRSYLNIILLQSRKLFEKYFPAYQNANTASRTIFKQFRVLLEANYRELKMPTEYADLLMIPEKRLNEICKDVRGKTVGDIIQERLILEAKRHLIHSELTAKEIAYFLNFEDASYFTKFFKRKTGHTPLEFKKMQAM